MTQLTRCNLCHLPVFASRRYLLRQSRLKYFCVAMVAAGMALKLSICIGTLRTTTPGV